MATFIQWVSTFVFGAIICLARGWQLTLVILTVAPVAAAVGVVVSKVVLLSPIYSFMHLHTFKIISRKSDNWHHIQRHCKLESTHRG